MNIAIIGLGLIGGSLGRAIVKRTDNKVFGQDTDNATMLKAELLQACHQRLDETAIGDIDLLIIAAGPRASIGIMQEAVPKLKDGCIVLDCSGTKRAIAAAMKKLSASRPALYFVGGHPMAGKEYSGISHSGVTLFDKASIIITPITASLEALSLLKSLFLQIGFGGTVITTPDTHDRIIAYTSQLAHIVSSAYVKSPMHAMHAGFSAGSFKDLTRVAKLNPTMWTELFMQNSDNLLHEIDTLIANLSAYKDAIAAGDEPRLTALLAEGAACKEAAETARKERFYD